MHDPQYARLMRLATRAALAVALTLVLAQRGVWGVRVHDVRGARDVLRVWERTR